MSGVWLVIAIAVVGGVGLFLQSRPGPGSVTAGGREGLLARLSADRQLAAAMRRPAAPLAGFELGKLTGTEPSADVLQHLTRLVERKVPLTASLAGQEHRGRFVRCEGTRRLVFRPVLPVQGLAVGATVSISYRTLRSGWTFLVALDAVGKRGDWALALPRTIRRLDSRGAHRLPLETRVLTLLIAGDLGPEEVPVVDVSDRGLQVLLPPSRVTLHEGDSLQGVLRAYGERAGLLQLVVRHVSNGTDLPRAGVALDLEDPEGLLILRQVCAAIRRSVSAPA